MNQTVFDDLFRRIQMMDWTNPRIRESIIEYLIHTNRLSGISLPRWQAEMMYNRNCRDRHIEVRFTWDGTQEDWGDVSG